MGRPDHLQAGDLVVTVLDHGRGLHRTPDKLKRTGHLGPGDLALVISVNHPLDSVVLLLNQRNELGWFFGGFLKRAMVR